jgi:hypothetical protein
LAGGRYKDLLESADYISDMKNPAKEILEKVSFCKENFRPESVKENAKVCKSSIGSGMDASQRKKLEIAALCKVFFDCKTRVSF